MLKPSERLGGQEEQTCPPRKYRITGQRAQQMGRVAGQVGRECVRWIPGELQRMMIDAIVDDVKRGVLESVMSGIG